MQAQPYALPFRQDFYHNDLDVYHTAPDHYFATSGLNDLGFSGGSSLSYPHQDYQFFSDRGDPSSLGLASTSSLSATGISITGATVSGGGFFRPEGIPDYQQQQQWQWSSAPDSLHGVSVAPIPRTPVAQFSTNKRSNGHGSMVLSPAAQLPTPASMAILLNPNSRSDLSSSQAPPTRPLNVHSAAQIAATGATPQEEPHRDPMAHAMSELHLREKKHACTMCHKRFDRPSTLRKHLLVHTGEKAFVCETCGRRFGVASNLNRHVKRCILKPVNTALAPSADTSTTPPTSAASGSHSPEASIDPVGGHSSNDRQANKRVRLSVSTSPVASSHSSDHTQSPQAMESAAASPPRAPRPRRRRRAPSPSRWIPPSLLSFNLCPPESQKATPVPLPPVKRHLPREERDSWDENVAASPYHPCGWKDVLPGPGLGLGLGGKDLRNLNLGGNGGFMLGRVLVF